MKCYHHNDLDGRCAASIVYRKYPECEFIEMDYNKLVDVKQIKEDEIIYIVDFSFKPEVMEKVIKKTKNIIWLDHHKTAFEYKYSINIDGIRDSYMSGCILTHIWLFPDKEIPFYVKLVDDYDRWVHQYENSKLFNIGMTIYEHSPVSDIWIALEEVKSITQDVIEKGRTCAKFRDNFCKDYIDSYSFEMKFEGYKCLVVGVHRFGSLTFGDNIDNYDICITYTFTGQNWVTGLYSKKIDVSKIAKKYGGGGHEGASGFVSDKPIWELNNNMKGE